MLPSAGDGVRPRLLAAVLALSLDPGTVVATRTDPCHQT